MSSPDGKDYWVTCPWCGKLTPPDLMDEGMCEECAKS